MRLKILYVFFHSYSDMPYHVREWVEAALELGHDVTVISAVDPVFLKSVGWENKINFMQVEYPGTGLKNYFKLLKNFKNTIKTAIKDQKTELIYERFSQISPATANIAEKANIPYCVEVNGIIENELALSGSSWLRQLFFKYIQRQVYSKATSIITVTEQIKKWINKKYSIPDKKIKTFNNGVNIKRFKPYDKLESRKKFNLPDDKFIVGFLGSLFPWNGLPHLIDAAKGIIKKYPDTYFLIGGGQEPMKSELEKMVHQKGLRDYFTFSGQIPWKNAPEYISSFDVAVETKENSKKTSFSPLKLYSYLACGKPVIASAIPGLEEFFQQHNVGMTFKSANSENLAEKLCEFRKLPNERIRKLHKNARKCVEKHYSWEKIVKESVEWIMKK